MLLQTTTTRENAETLIKIALECHLSACVHQSTIKSHYFWCEESLKQNDSKHRDSKPKAVCEEEILLHFKVFKKDFKKLQKLILAHHSYSLPEIIGIPLCKVSKQYQKWCWDSKRNF